MNKCFECEATKDLQKHHPVPKSRGGRKTVTLCYQCHMKAHGRDAKGLNHKKLTKEGLARAKERGVKLGNPNPVKSLGKCKEANRRRGNKTIARCGPIITDLRNSGLSYAKIANQLNDMQIPTPSKRGKWNKGTTFRIYEKFKEDK